MEGITVESEELREEKWTGILSGEPIHLSGEEKRDELMAFLTNTDNLDVFSTDMIRLTHVCDGTGEQVTQIRGTGDLQVKSEVEIPALPRLVLTTHMAVTEYNPQRGITIETRGFSAPQLATENQGKFSKIAGITNRVISQALFLLTNNIGNVRMRANVAVQQNPEGGYDSFLSVAYKVPPVMTPMVPAQHVLEENLNQVRGKILQGVEIA